MNASELFSFLKRSLKDLYPEIECKSIHRHVLSNVLAVPFEETAYKSYNLSTSEIEDYKQFVEELSSGKPLQYILGETEFYDCKIFVSEGVLIPRPETEEIVHHLVQQIGSKEVQILDIGTGSGCIPISVAKHCKNASVFAFDISNSALQIAERNAKENNVKVAFRNVDILSWKEQLFDHTYDIIISNPPYVLESEKQVMQKNVLDYEPELALFVPDSDPLRFYNAIADFATEYLNIGGTLFFEINEQFGNETVQMLKSKGFSEVQLFSDLQGKHRWTECVWNI